MNILRLLTAVLLQTATTPAPTASVEGVVVRLGTNEPIPGAFVELSRYETFLASANPPPGPPAPQSEPPSVFSTTTSDDGRFVFREVPGGRYRLVAIRTGAGYTPAEYGQRDPKGRGTSFVLSEGQRMTNIELSMAPTGSISGRVIDADDEPVGNARVMALEPAYRDGRRTLNIVQAVRTNDLGEYRLFWLRPGRYYVGVKPQDGRNFSFSVHIASPEVFGSREDASSPVVTDRKLADGQTIEETDLVVYYGGGTDPQKAQSIDLYSASTVSAIDIPVNHAKARVRRVKGVVVNGLTGQPVPNALVRVVSRQPAPHTMMPNATTNPQGAFAISGVIPGSHYLSVTVGGGRGFSFNESFLELRGDGQAALVPIEIAETDLENMTVLLRPGFSLPGRIYLDGAGQSAVFDVTNLRVSLVRDPDLMGLPSLRGGPTGPGQPASGVPTADGAFTLSGFAPGYYRVRLMALPSTAYLKTIRLAGVDVLNDGFQVDNPPEGQLEIVVNLNGSTLEGIVVNEKTEPVVNAMVVLVPDATQRHALHLYKVDPSDTQGRFEIKGIAPGDYQLFAWEYIDGGAWLNADFLRAFEARGTPIRIAGGTQKVQVTVLPPAR